jgi:hypothetical protein
MSALESRLGMHVSQLPTDCLKGMNSDYAPVCHPNTKIINSCSNADGHKI